VTLENVKRFDVPQAIVEKTERSLRAAGREGYELFVLWTGRETDDVFQVLDAHVPRQQSARTRDGLHVSVEGEALHRLNMWLYQNEQILGAQIHAHPTEAFHSETDSTWPIVTTRGGLSLVVADFCRHGLLASSSAPYRLEATGWTEAPLSVLRVT
jgi:hypothetical protein